jgi:hypothetical protein
MILIALTWGTGLMTADWLICTDVAERNFPIIQFFQKQQFVSGIQKCKFDYLKKSDVREAKRTRRWVWHATPAQRVGFPKCWSSRSLKINCWWFRWKSFNIFMHKLRIMIQASWNLTGNCHRTIPWTICCTRHSTWNTHHMTTSCV